MIMNTTAPSAAGERERPDVIVHSGTTAATMRARRTTAAKVMA
jgi:hypothetical protein